MPEALCIDTNAKLRHAIGAGNPGIRSLCLTPPFTSNRRFVIVSSILSSTMAGMSLALIATIGLAVYVLKKLFLDQKENHAPLPPGPKGLPLVGNLTDLPPPGVPEYFHWMKHKDIHGPISSVTVLGQTLIIINNKDAAFELMDKRSNIYSGRAKMKFAEMYVNICGS